MNKFSALACALIFSTSVMAIENPIPSRDDPRIQYVDFKDNDVVRVNAANGFMTTIVFSDGEEITDYGSGFSSAWEFASSHNFFFLKPKDVIMVLNLIYYCREACLSPYIEFLSLYTIWLSPSIEKPSGWSM